MAVVTALLFVLMLVVNEWMFASLIFTQGANWIYLPAGVRLLCTLLFAEAGAVGLCIGAWLTGFFYFFQVMGGVRFRVPSWPRSRPMACIAWPADIWA